MRRHARLSRPQAIELLARGVSLSAIARATGYHDNTAIRHRLSSLGVRRVWVLSDVPVIEVRRG